jgi:hypothetical protein
MVAFGATAALAVTLNRPVHAPAERTIASRQQITRQQVAPACASAGLAVSLTVTHKKGAVASGSVDFTNTSGSTCTLSGFPQVSAYEMSHHGYAQVGNPAMRETGGKASRVLLRPGGTAHSDVDISLITTGGACKPVTAAGLRVVPPGASRPQYVRTRVSACSKAGPGAQFYLSVRAIAPGPGSTAVVRSAPARR